MPEHASQTPGDDATLLAAIEAQFAASLRSLAGTWRDLAAGWSIRTDDLPWVWTLNQVGITSTVTLDELVDLAEAHQGDLPYRHVVVRDASTIEALERQLLARGWSVERDVVMALTSRAAPDGPDDRVGELTEDEMLALMASWLQEERFGISADGLGQVLEYNRREGQHFGERRLGVVADDGTPLAVTKLRTDGAFGWVEDVYTLPTARRQGYARALVGRAVDLALEGGSRIVAIVADADDWPQHLYERVGFRRVGAASIYHLEVSATP